MAIVSDDEKPSIQAIATTAPDLPPEPSEHATFARDHEYKRLGAVHALVKDRHRSREFIEFLKLLDPSASSRAFLWMSIRFPGESLKLRNLSFPRLGRVDNLLKAHS
jgi:hypothetical protein